MAENRKLILVVDDEPDTLTFFSTLLEDHGYEVVTAKDGAEALRHVEDRRPDLVTLDITMPEKSGVRFYRDLRESAEWKAIPVVIVTGVSGDFERFISTRKQVPPPEGYLSKPVDREKLLETVRQLLG
jgi:CheY-like chemotaxis protein